MALSFGTPKYDRLPQSGTFKEGYVDVTFDSSYPTGGEAITYASIVGLAAVLAGMWQIASNLTTYLVHYDSTGGTLVVWDEDSEVTNTTDLTGLTVRMAFKGI